MHAALRSLVLCAVSLLAGRVSLADGNDAALRTAIETAIPLLQTSAATYTENRDCFSCHHQSLVQMTLATVRSAGVAVNDKAAKEQTEFTLKYFAERKEKLLTGKGVPGGAYS